MIDLELDPLTLDPLTKDWLYPLKDCIQDPLDENYDRILIYSYTDSPTKPCDGFAYWMKNHDIYTEVPIYLHTELWEWDGERYIKKAWREKIIEGFTIPNKEAMEIITEKYLYFIVKFREEDMNYKADFKLKHDLPETSLGYGCKWNRRWAHDDAF
jgi:hypothetical protein